MTKEYQRDAVLESNDSVIDAEQRTVQITFSTEDPVAMGDYTEILGHGPEEIDFTRLASGTCPLLYNHNRSEQIGIVERAWIEGGKGKALVRFSKNPTADEYFKDIQDGIRKSISVGYSRDQFIQVAEGVIRTTRWTPYEISLVTVPADINARVGRSRIDSGGPESAVSDVCENEAVQAQEAAINTPGLMLDVNTEIATINTPEASTRDAEEKQQQTLKETAMTQEVKVEDIKAAERARVTEIRALGTKFNLSAEADKFINEDKTVDQFRALVLEKQDATATATKVNTFAIGSSEKREYSLAKAVLSTAPASVRGSVDVGYEREVSQEIARQTGRAPQVGVFIPSAAARAAGDPMTTVAVGEGKELVATSRVGHIDPLYNRLAVKQAGATVITGLRDNIEFSKSGKASFGWLAAENDASTKSTPSTGYVTMSPKTARGLVKFSHKLLLQSNPSVEALLRADLDQGMAETIDIAALYGTGLNGQPKGVFNWAGVGSVTALEAKTWSGVNKFVTTVLSANLAGTKFIGTPQVAGMYNTTQKVAGTDSVMIMNGYNNLIGFDYISSLNAMNGAENGLVFGDFSQLIIGQWGATEIAVSDSNEDDFDRGLLSIRVLANVDVLVRQPGAFAVAKNIVV